MERTGRKLEYQIAYEDPAYVVIRISEMMKNWKELSMHVDTEGGDVTAKFYMNIKEIQKVGVTSGTVRTGISDVTAELQIGYDTAQIDVKNEEIEQLKQENEKMQERIEKSRTTDTYPTEAEAENAQGIIDRAENQIQSNEDTISRETAKKRSRGWKREVRVLRRRRRDETKGGSVLIVFVGAEAGGTGCGETYQVHGEDWNL